MKANVTVMSLIDLREIYECKVKLNGKEMSIVSLLKNNDKLYVMIAGGYYIEVNQETYDRLNEILTEHFKKHIFKK